MLVWRVAPYSAVYCVPCTVCRVQCVVWFTTPVPGSQGHYAMHRMPVPGSSPRWVSLPGERGMRSKGDCGRAAARSAQEEGYEGRIDQGGIGANRRWAGGPLVPCAPSDLRCPDVSRGPGLSRGGRHWQGMEAPCGMCETGHGGC